MITFQQLRQNVDWDNLANNQRAAVLNAWIDLHPLDTREELRRTYLPYADPKVTSWPGVLESSLAGLTSGVTFGGIRPEDFLSHNTPEEAAGFRAALAEHPVANTIGNFAGMGLGLVVADAAMAGTPIAATLKGMGTVPRVLTDAGVFTGIGLASDIGHGTVRRPMEYLKDFGTNTAFIGGLHALGPALRLGRGALGKLRGTAEEVGEVTSKRVTGEVRPEVRPEDLPPDYSAEALLREQGPKTTNPLAAEIERFRKLQGESSEIGEAPERLLSREDYERSLRGTPTVVGEEGPPLSKAEQWTRKVREGNLVNEPLPARNLEEPPLAMEPHPFDTIQSSVPSRHPMDKVFSLEEVKGVIQDLHKGKPVIAHLHPEKATAFETTSPEVQLTKVTPQGFEGITVEGQKVHLQFTPEKTLEGVHSISPGTLKVPEGTAKVADVTELYHDDPLVERFYDEKGKVVQEAEELLSKVNLKDQEQGRKALERLQNEIVGIEQELNNGRVPTQRLARFLGEQERIPDSSFANRIVPPEDVQGILEGSASGTWDKKTGKYTALPETPLRIGRYPQELETEAITRLKDWHAKGERPGPKARRALRMLKGAETLDNLVEHVHEIDGGTPLKTRMRAHLVHWIQQHSGASLPEGSLSEALPNVAKVLSKEQKALIRQALGEKGKLTLDTFQELERLERKRRIQSYKETLQLYGHKVEVGHGRVKVTVGKDTMEFKDYSSFDEYYQRVMKESTLRKPRKSQKTLEVKQC